MNGLRVPDYWRLLEIASIEDVAADEKADDVASVIAGVDWDQLVVAAIRHRLLPRLADFLVRSERISEVPEDVRGLLTHALRDSRYRAAVQTREAAEVVAALRENDVVAACTKGITFQSTLYGGFGGRTFEDIDLMIHEESREVVTSALTHLGYLETMAYDPLTDRIVPLARRTKAMYRMYPDHLPHFLRPLSGQALPCFIVDVCFNITWYGAAWQIPMREVLADVATVAVPVFDDVVELPALTAPYDFVFTAMHLFREGWFERNEAFEHLRLGQFADLVRQWRRLTPEALVALTELVAAHAIGPPTAWVCHHVDEIFGTAITTGLGLDEFRDDAWLHSASAVDGSYLSWAGDMRDRLRLRQPLELAPAPAPRFAADARVGRR